MRQILSKEELEKKQKRTNKLIGVLLLLIMLVSVAAVYYDMGDDSGSKDSKSKVQEYGGIWEASYGGANLRFMNSPEKALNGTKIDFAPDINLFYNQPLYINSNSTAVFYEIYSNLGLFALRTSEACYVNNPDCENSDFVEKDCTSNLIVFKESQNKSITQNQSCIFIEGDLSTADAFLYKIFRLA